MSIALDTNKPSAGPLKFQPLRNPTIRNLPPELIEEITSFLTKKEGLTAHRTAKLFHDTHPFTTHISQISDAPSFLAALAKGKLRKTRSLKLFSCSAIANAILNGLPNSYAPLLSGLTHLDLSLTDLTDNQLFALLTLWTNLISLNLRLCDELTHRSFNTIATHGRNLTELDLRSCGEIVYGQLAVAHFPKLTLLNLGGCIHLNNGNLYAIAAHSPKLSHLYLGSCDQVTDQGLTSLSIRLTNLVHLDLWCCRKLTGEGLVVIASHCPDLIFLNLAFCLKITDPGLIAVLTHCKRLTDLNVEACGSLTPVAIASIATLGKNLTTFTAGSNHYLRDAPDHLDDSRLTEIAIECIHLRYLDLRECKKITTLGFRALLTHCQNLKILQILFWREASRLPDSMTEAFRKKGVEIR